LSRPAFRVAAAETGDTILFVFLLFPHFVPFHLGMARTRAIPVSHDDETLSESWHHGSDHSDALFLINLLAYVIVLHILAIPVD
jgi:hypothetical protein